MNYLKPVALSLVVALSLALGAVSQVAAEDTVANGEDRLAAGVRDTDPLIGAWVVTLTDDSNPLPNNALYSFLPGGVLHQSETPMTDPMLNNLVFSNAHGAWEYNDKDDSYAIRYFKLSYRADASFAGKEETTGKLELDEDGKLIGSVSIGGQFRSVFKGERITVTSPK